MSSQDQISDEHLWIWDLSTGSVVNRIGAGRGSATPMEIALTLDGSQLVVAAGSELLIVELKY
jgi:hypothetical protein